MGHQPGWAIRSLRANGLGFDYFYGFNAGDMNHWDPILYENRNLVQKSTDPDYHLTTDIADKAIAWVRQVSSLAANPPYMLYVATGYACRTIYGVSGRTNSEQFDGGWDKYRELTLGAVYYY